MPVPERRKGESHEKFMERCMSDKTMNKEYEQKQRAAICLSQSRKRPGAPPEPKSAEDHPPLPAMIALGAVVIFEEEEEEHA